MKCGMVWKNSEICVGGWKLKDVEEGNIKIGGIKKFEKEVLKKMKVKKIRKKNKKNEKNEEKIELIGCGNDYLYCEKFIGRMG